MFSKFQNEIEATKFDRKECAMIHLFGRIDGVVMSNHHTLDLCWRPGFLPADSSAANNTDFLTSSSTWWPGDAVLLFVASKIDQLLATASHLKQYKHNINDTYTSSSLVYMYIRTTRSESKHFVCHSEVFS